MPVLLVVQFSILDPNKFQQYAEASRETIRRFKGRVVARGAVEELHGEAPHTMGAVVEFPDRATALNWFQSDEYQVLSPTRDEASEATFLLYPGFRED